MGLHLFNLVTAACDFNCQVVPAGWEAESEFTLAIQEFPKGLGIEPGDLPNWEIIAFVELGRIFPGDLFMLFLV